MKSYFYHIMVIVTADEKEAIFAHKRLNPQKTANYYYNILPCTHNNTSRAVYSNLTIVAAECAQTEIVRMQMQQGHCIVSSHQAEPIKQMYTLSSIFLTKQNFTVPEL